MTEPGRAIVVVVDSLHAGFLGCYGNEWVETRNLDRFAHEALLFDQCFPLEPRAGGWRSATFGAGLAGVSESNPLLGSLGNRGVARVLLSDRPPASISGEELQQFDEFQFFEEPEPPTASLPNIDELRHHSDYRLPTAEAPRFADWSARWLRQCALHGMEYDRSIELLLATAAQWVREHERESFLLWIEVGFLASRWRPPDSFHRMYLDEPDAGAVVDPMPGMVDELYTERDLAPLRCAYAGRVSYLDVLLGAFLEQLRESGVYNSALVVMTADQGTPLGEHGAIGDCRPWLYEERCHVPLIVRLPGGRTGARTPALAQSPDLHPTIAGHFGVAHDASPFGVDWRPLVRGEPVKLRDYACAGLDDREYSIRTHQWHLVLPVQPDSAEPRDRELYVKPEDRWDMNNQLDQHLDVADRLELQLRRYLDASRRGLLHRLPPMHL